MSSKQKLSIYAHYPFCVRKCPYCDFVSYDDDPTDTDAYVDASIKEIAGFKNAADVDIAASTIYLGGGTPSLMSQAQIEKLISAIDKAMPIEKNAEITIELNPATADKNNMTAWRKAGVNRLSIGVQSTNDEILKKLGRIHSAQEAKAAYIAGREAGFDSVGVDLIFGVPGQSLSDFERDIKELVSWRPDHASTYALNPPDDWPVPSEDIISDMYLKSIEALEAAGLMQYEISNFAKSGFESLHNYAYWTFVNYLGVGVSAHSFVNFADFGIRKHAAKEAAKAGSARNPVRWWNIDDPDEYICGIEERGDAIDDAEEIDEERHGFEKVFLGLRLKSGLDATQVSGDIAKRISGIATELVEQGLATFNRKILSLTPRGMLLADEIAKRIV